MLAQTSLPSQLGPITVFWDPDRDKVTAIRLPKSAKGRPKVPPRDPGAETKVGRFLEQLRAYFAGQRPTFDLAALDLDTVPAFHRQVYEYISKLPPGETRSYGEVAVALGRPRGARAVGNAMARNPFPLIVPCHRVLAANGALGGFSAGLDTKRELLTHEGAIPA